MINYQGQMNHDDAQKFLEWLSQKMLETVDPDDALSPVVVEVQLWIDGPAANPTIRLEIADGTLSLFDWTRKYLTYGKTNKPR